MPSRICLTCDRYTHWRNRRGSTVPKNCTCGGKLVHEREHPKTVARWLQMELRHLAWLESPERADPANITNGGYYSPDRLERHRKLSRKRVEKMRAILPKTEITE